MLSCVGCKNRGKTGWGICGRCVGFNNYEPYGPSASYQVSYSKPDISREMEMLAKASLNNLFGVKNAKRKTDMRIKKVIFNDPATVIIWKDGTKTIVRAGVGEGYDPEKGLAMAIAKKALGNQGNYYEVFKKWLPEEKEEEALSPLDKLKQGLANLTIPKLPIATDVKVTKKDEGIEVTGKLVTLLTAEKLAEKLGVTKATIQKQCRQGLHPGAVKVGGKWKIPYTE